MRREISIIGSRLILFEENSQLLTEILTTRFVRLEHSRFNLLCFKQCCSLPITYSYI